MKFILFALAFFILAAGFTHAEKKEKTSNPASGFKKEKVVKMRSGKFSRIFLNMMHKARSLEISDEQQKEINGIRRKYFDSIAGEEKKSRMLQRTFMKQLENKEFDPSELKTVSVEIQEANLKAADNFIEGITKLKEVVGSKNFAKLYPITKISRNALIQLREESLKHSENIERTADKQPKSEAKSK